MKTEFVINSKFMDKIIKFLFYKLNAIRNSI